MVFSDFCPDGQGVEGNALNPNEENQADPNWTGHQTLAIYVLAGLVYVSLGIFIPELLFSWWVGVPFLLLFVWIANALWKRFA